MKDELEKRLINDYPDLFRGHTKPSTESLMCFGCACGDGWYELLRETCDKLKDFPTVEFVQIKEKFGGLRIYARSASEDGWYILNEAEDKSYSICEVCGAPGKVRTGGWIKTLCDDCDARG